MVGDIVMGGDSSGSVWSVVEARRREWDLRHGEHRHWYQAGPRIGRGELTVADPSVGERQGIVWLRSVAGYGEGPVTDIGDRVAVVSLRMSVLLQEVWYGLSGVKNALWEEVTGDVHAQSREVDG